MRYFIVDAFTTKPFKGNPAAVVVLDKTQSDRQLQAIAMEFNLAETAFLLRENTDHWSLRWFTPKIEIDLCGHATLASAHVIWEKLQIAREKQYFSTQSGELTAIPSREDDKSGAKIELNFPAVATQVANIDATVLQSLNLDVCNCAQTEHNLLLEVSDPNLIANYQPDFAVIGQLPNRGLIITAKGQSNIDFVSRFFAPKIGIPEDPVTGAIHCALGPYWANKLDKTQMQARQLSERGGHLEVQLDGDRVLLRGAAVCTMQGELLV